MYGLAQSTAPTEEPLTVDEVKRRIGVPVEVTVNDEMLTSQLAAARKWVEDRTNRQLCTASWTMTLENWPPCKILLPRAPLRSVTTIHYLEATAGASTLWASSNYRVATNKEPGEVTLAYGASFPSVYPVSNTITIVYSAGYGARSAVPDIFKQAIAMKCGEWWAINPSDAQRCAMAVENLIPSLSYGDDFVRYSEGAYA